MIDSRRPVHPSQMGIVRSVRREAVSTRARNAWTYLLPFVFMLALVAHYKSVIFPDVETIQSTTAADHPEKESPRQRLAPPDNVALILPPPAPVVASSSLLRTVRIAPRRMTHAVPPPPSANDLVVAETGPVVAVAGNENGLQIRRAPAAASGASSVAAIQVMPTAGQLDGMEFVIDVSPGSIEDLVRKLDGAFMRNGRLHDARGKSVTSMDRFSTSGRMIVFYTVDGGAEVVLPNSVVEAVLRQVTLKAAGSIPRRITASFDILGNLRNVDVEV